MKADSVPIAPKACPDTAAEFVKSFEAPIKNTEILEK